MQTTPCVTIPKFSQLLPLLQNILQVALNQVSFVHTMLFISIPSLKAETARNLIHMHNFKYVFLLLT